MKKIVFLFFLLSTKNLSAQPERCIFYDNAGNRVKREACPGYSPLIQNGGESELTKVSAPAVEVNALPLLPLRNIFVLPNPTSGIVQISYPDSSPEAIVQFYDNTGTQVFCRSLSSGMFDLSQLPSGVYYINIAQTSFSKNTMLIKI